ncbi:MAG: hypothetical protein IPO08_14855 [Xanthomonadales bacterium]|nr:hypothetical protein [Xanthomonadales bacterium]
MQADVFAKSLLLDDTAVAGPAADGLAGVCSESKAKSQVEALTALSLELPPTVLAL